MLSHPKKNKSLLHSDRFSLISVSTHCLPSCHWAQWEEPGFFTHLPSRPLHTWIRSPWAFLLQSGRSQLSQPLLVCQILQDLWSSPWRFPGHTLGVRQTALDKTLLLCLTRAEQRGAQVSMLILTRFSVAHTLPIQLRGNNQSNRESNPFSYFWTTESEFILQNVVNLLSSHCYENKTTFTLRYKSELAKSLGLLHNL